VVSRATSGPGSGVLRHPTRRPRKSGWARGGSPYRWRARPDRESRGPPANRPGDRLAEGGRRRRTAGVAGGRVLGHRPGQHPVHVGRQVGPAGGGPRAAVRSGGPPSARADLARERDLAGQALVGDARQRVLVTPPPTGWWDNCSGEQ
jgi:hypothetical protein